LLKIRGKKKDFVKKIKNPNALDTYLSRKEKKNSKSTLFKITPHVTKKLAFPYIQSYAIPFCDIWLQRKNILIMKYLEI